MRNVHEEKAFDELYEKSEREGDFRKRTEEERKELKKYVFLLKVRNSVLGALALIPRGEWMEFSALCSPYNGTGIGNDLLQAGIRETEEQGKSRIYAFTEEKAKLFHQNGFDVRGRVSELQQQPPTSYECLPCVQDYDTQALGRDPFFCTWLKEITDVRKGLPTSLR